MTKNFCDICEQPAVDIWIEAKMQFPSLQWHGTKTHHSSPNPTDGTWIPFVTVRPVLDMENHKGNPNKHHPDLCANCMFALLTLLLEKAHQLITPPLPAK